jgi:hypothetical protein
MSGPVLEPEGNRKADFFSFLLVLEAFFVCLIKYRALLYVANKELTVETYCGSSPQLDWVISRGARLIPWYTIYSNLAAHNLLWKGGESKILHIRCTLDYLVR